MAASYTDPPLMYAIVKAGGKQYRVEQGDTLLVDRMKAEEGDTVALQPLLLAGGDDDPVFDSDALGKVSVEAVVRGHERGKKIHVLKFKPKRGYKRRMGARADLTRLEILNIKRG
ncbi:MAG: large subunit ribosomal protein [Thermoleophilaceae bacterium]|jgi:large subunit ribosomal protein L21|nr:large subunit ribosomal protein [Thermoleophilaceae bacterium]